MADEKTLRIFIESPAGDRFESNIPCSSKIGQVAGDFFDALGWPTEDRHDRPQRAVVALVDPRTPNNTKRLNSDWGICESGLRDGDTLRIFLESQLHNDTNLRSLRQSETDAGVPNEEKLPSNDSRDSFPGSDPPPFDGKPGQLLRIFIETPAGDRFEADVPCVVTVSQVAADFFRAMGWPTEDRNGRVQRAVVELLDPRSPDNTMRLDMDRGLCESGLRDGDTLRIIPESAAGPVFDKTGTWLHTNVKRHHILRIQRGMICQIAWSPNGELLASASTNGQVCLWDMGTGQLFRTLPLTSYVVDTVTSMAWSPDGKVLALAFTERKILLWDMDAGLFHQLTGYNKGAMTSIAWSPDGKVLAAASTDRTVFLWDTDARKLLHAFIAHQDAINSVTWSPDGSILASASTDRTICLWNTDTRKLLRTFTGHQDAINSIAWSPDGKVLASSAEDRTIRIWHISHNQQTHSIEGFTEFFDSISFSSDGHFLAAKSPDGTIRLWRSGIWEERVIVREDPSIKRSLFSRFSPFAFHPHDLTMANSGEGNTAVHVLGLNPDTLFTSSIASSVTYANAKVVLLGDTGVGKTGLSLVLTEKPYTETDSTHGRHVWDFNKTEVPLDEVHAETREIFLWDLAGQQGYRLFHQLHLSEATVALVVFDDHSETNPFAGVRYWHRALCQAQLAHVPPLPLKKFLVAARMDRGGIGVSDSRIQSLIKELGFDGYFKTSAKAGQGIVELRKAIQETIDWQVIPKVTSTYLFRQIKEFLIARKRGGRLLSLMKDLYHDFLNDRTGELYEKFECCIESMEARGLIRRFRLANCVLLQPELLDAYATALFNAMKDEPDGLGIIDEEKVKDAKFLIPADERMKDKGEERLLLTLMVEDLLAQGVVLREQGAAKTLLIFPSQFSHEKAALSDMSGKTVVFSFAGPVQNIYATLVVRLSYSGMFQRKELWKNAVTYMTSAGGTGTYGILLENTDEGEGSLTLFFEQASEEMRFHFEGFVSAHLSRRWQLNNMHRQRLFSCPDSECNTTLPNDIVQKRLKRNIDWLTCPVCEKRVSLLDGEERIKVVDPSVISEMNQNADKGVNASRRDYVFKEKSKFQILINEAYMTVDGDNIRINDISNIGGQQIVGKARDVNARINPQLGPNAAKFSDNDGGSDDSER